MFAAFHAISTGRWENDYRIAFFVVLMDSLQVALFLIDPVFDWDINWENIAWRWVRRVHLQNQPTVMSYNVRRATPPLWLRSRAHRGSH